MTTADTRDRISVHRVLLTGVDAGQWTFSSFLWCRLSLEILSRDFIGSINTAAPAMAML